MRGSMAAMLLSASLVAGCAGAVAPTSTPSATPPPSVAPATAAATFAPSPSPVAILDGEPWIAYEWWLPDHEEQDIFLARPDGSDAHPILTEIPGEHRGPAWSPDGQRLAFVVRGDDTTTPDGGIWFADADGSNAGPILANPRECPYGAFWPSWSPDGKRISITCYRPGAATLQILDLATFTLTEVYAVAAPEVMDAPASWSPDGTRLAFDILRWPETEEYSNGSLLAIADLDRGTVKRITDFDSFAAAPNWHPSQELIAFTKFDMSSMKLVPDVGGLFTIEPDGSNRRQVAIPPDTSVRFAGPRWYPDGSGMLAGLGHGNPVGWAEIVVVSVADGTWSSLTQQVIGSGGKLRPTP
jgi:Tol biopolymer transport system component